jgi:hypothetical protein
MLYAVFFFLRAARALLLAFVNKYSVYTSEVHECSNNLAATWTFYAPDES